MDTNEDLKQYEKKWSAKVERASTEIFNLAIRVTEENPDVKVVIMKRMPRFDTKSQDPTSAKSKLSDFADRVYDQLWFKHGSPANIKIATLNLGCSTSQHLKNIIMGNPDSQSYDGIHLRGPAASRHFTYRAVQEIRSVIMAQNGGNFARGVGKHVRLESNVHINCPQTEYQRQSHVNHSQERMSKSKKTAQPTRNYNYNIPTKNSFSPLGNC